MENNSNFILFMKRECVDYLMIIYFLFLTLLPLVSIISLITLTVLFVFGGNYRNLFSIMKKDFMIKLFLGYYLLHVFGIFYSTNLTYGFKDLQTKLSFLIVPLVFSGLTISKERFSKIKLSFIFSSAISLSVLFFISAKKYLFNSDLNEFVYSKLAHSGHSTYLSIYFNLAMLFVLEKYYRDDKKFSVGLTAVLFFFLYIGILLLSARTATFVTIISVAFYPILLFGKTFFKEKIWHVHVLFLFFMSALLFGYLHYNNRFNQVEQEIVLRTNSANAESIQQEAPNSTNIRLHIWKNSVELIRRNPILGVGTGDLKEELVNMYTENNYQYGIQSRISPHNQFLHTGVILGIVGILFLTAYLLLPMVIAFKNKDWLYLIFLFVIIVNCITESILEREAGILFFTVFNTCFYLQLISKKVSIENNN